MNINNLTADYLTFGCKLNYAETSAIEELMVRKGIIRAEFGQSPDFIIVNTCSVTSEAGKKSVRAIRAAHKKHPEAAIIVTGCHAQLHADELADLEGVAVIAGNDRKLLTADYIDAYIRNGKISINTLPAKDFREFEHSCARGERTRFFLKVQDGCDYWCSYCTIPRARGRSRSPEIQSLVAQAQRAAELGGKEIVITGVNIGDFGKNSPHNFLDLIKALDKVEGIERYRISSIEPNLLTDEILDFTASSNKFMPHFHIPLQSGSDEVLRLMRRRYDTEMFAHKIENVRRVMPDAFIGIDLIVGARGEKPELFEESYDFIDSLDISRLHVFTYSERADTAALDIPFIVSQEEKHARTRRMLELSRRKLESFCKRFEGTQRRVLVEHPCSTKPAGGFTDNYLRVVIDPASMPGDFGAFDNQLVRVELGKADIDNETVNARLIL